MSERIRIYGDPVLRKKSKALNLPGEQLLVVNLINRLFSVLDKAEGIGLAAPQIGESFRLFVALPGYLEELQGHTVFINPIVKPYGDPEKKEEGCLSIPGIYETFFRPERARITAVDKNGLQFTLDLGGLAARLVQHETDHLDGILFVDRLSSIKKKLLKRKLKNLVNENIAE